MPPLACRAEAEAKAGEGGPFRSYRQANRTRAWTYRLNLAPCHATLACFQALTATDRLSDLLPVLHHHAISAIQGRRLHPVSVQPERRSPSGDLGLRRRSAAARSVAGPPGARVAVPRWPAAVRARSPDGSFAASASIWIPLPPSSYRSPTSTTLSASSSSGRSPHRPPIRLREVGSVGHAFAIVLERTRVASEADLQFQLRNLLQRILTDRVVKNDVRRAGYIVRRRESAVWRRSHVGLASRSARANGRAVGIFRRRLSRAGATDPRVRCAGAGGGWPAGAIEPKLPASGRADWDGHGPAQRSAPGARSADHGRTATRIGIADGPAGSCRRARPPGIGSGRERPAARRRSAIAPRAGKDLQRARGSGRRLRSGGPADLRQPRVSGAQQQAHA